MNHASLEPAKSRAEIDYRVTSSSHLSWRRLHMRRSLHGRFAKQKTHLHSRPFVRAGGLPIAFPKAWLGTRSRKTRNPLTRDRLAAVPASLSWLLSWLESLSGTGRRGARKAPPPMREDACNPPFISKPLYSISPTPTS